MNEIAEIGLGPQECIERRADEKAGDGRSGLEEGEAVKAS